MWTVEQLEPKLLLSADLMPGIQEITGAIDQPGQQKQYEFVIKEKTKFFFDGVEGENFNWSLQGKEYGKNFSAIELNQDSHKFLELTPDTYKLTIDGNNDQVGNYKFRLFGEESAIKLEPNQETHLNLNPASQAVLYQIDAAAGDRIFFESHINDATWSIFDNNAQLVKNRLTTNDSQGFVAEKSGSYWLSIDSSTHYSNLEGNFTLHVLRPEISSININEEQIVNFNKPFESKQFNFKIDQDQWVVFDQITEGLKNTEWSIKDESSSIIFSPLSTLESKSKSVPKFLKTGTYTLEINSLNITAGEIKFIVKTNSKVDDLIDENNKGLILNNIGTESKFVKINNGSNELISLISERYISEIEYAKNIDLENFTEKLVNSHFALSSYDLFELKLNKDDKLLLEKEQPNTLIRIFDRYGNEIVKAEANSLSFNVTEKGLYYIGISTTDNNNYNINSKPGKGIDQNVLLKIKYKSAIEIDNQLDDVRDSIWTGQQLDILKTEKLQVTIGDNETNYNDVDFYKFQVKKGNTINISAPRSTEIQGFLKIFDITGRELVQTSNSAISYTFNADGEYYLAFSSESNKYYNPYFENSGNYGKSTKGTITVDIKLTTTDIPKVYLLDRYGNLILDTNIHQLDLIKQKINLNEEYYLWINSSTQNVNSFEYSIGLSNLKEDRFDLNDSKKIEYKFDSFAQTYGVELNVTESGTYFIYPEKTLVNTKWNLSGPGVKNLEWSNNVKQGDNIAQAVYLTKGFYKLSISNYDSVGSFGLDFISSKLAAPIQSGQDYTVEHLVPGQFITYQLDSRILDEYSFQLNTANPDLNITVWDQYGKILSNYLTDNTNFYQDYEQNKIFITIANDSLVEAIDNISFKVNTIKHDQPVNVVKSISLGQTVEDFSKDLPRNINYDFKLEKDSFISFEFLKNIYEEVLIVGPEGENLLNKTNIYTGWLVAGQYYIEFKNKIKNSNFIFQIRDVSQFETLDKNITRQVELSSQAAVYHFSMDEEHDYSISASQYSEDYNFKILSIDGFTLFDGKLSNYNFNLNRKDLIDDYILIIESTNNKNSELNFRLSSFPKKVEINDSTVMDFVNLSSTRDQEFEINVDADGLYFFDLTYTGSLNFRFDERSFYQTIGSQSSEETNYQALSFALTKGKHKVYLTALDNNDVRAKLNIQSVANIPVLEKVGSELIVPTLEANQISWLKLATDSYADFKLNYINNPNITIQIFNENGELYKSFDNDFTLNAEDNLDYLYFSIHNKSNNEVSGLTFGLEPKYQHIDINQELHFNSLSSDVEPFFSFDIVNDGFITIEFLSKNYQSFKVIDSHGEVYSGAAEYVNNISGMAYQTLWLQSGQYKLEFELTNTVENSSINDFYLNIADDSQTQLINLNQNTEVDLIGSSAYQVYEFNVSNSKSYSIKLLNDVSNIQFRLLTMDGVEWFSGQLASESTDLGPVVFSQKYKLVIWSAADQNLVNPIVLLEETENLNNSISVTSKKMVEPDQELILDGQIDVNQDFQIITLEIKQDGLYFLNQLQQGNLLNWSLLGPRVQYNSINSLDGLYLRRGVYFLAIANSNHEAVNYKFSIFSSMSIENELLKDNSTNINSLAKNESVFYKLSVGLDEELLFKTLNSFSGLKVDLWTDNGGYIGSYINIESVFDIVLKQKQLSSAIYLSVTNISSDTIKDINFTVVDKRPHIDIYRNNIIDYKDLYNGIEFDFNIDEKNLFSFNIEQNIGVSYQFFKLVNGVECTVSSLADSRNKLYLFEEGNYIIKSYFNFIPDFEGTISINFNKFDENKTIDLVEHNTVSENSLQVYKFIADSSFQYFIDFPDYNNPESSSFLLKLMDENGQIIMSDYYYRTLSLPLLEHNKKYWLIIENLNGVEANLDFSKTVRQQEFTVNSSTSLKVDQNFDFQYQQQEIILKVEEAGTYFFNVSAFDSVNYQLVGVGGNLPNNQPMFASSSISTNRNLNLQATHLQKGIYKIVAKSNWLTGFASFEILSASQAHNLLVNNETIIEQLEVDETVLYKVSQDYFATYTDNYNRFTFKDISENYGVEFNFWTQDGTKIGDNPIELLKTQPFFYISAMNIGSEKQTGIKFSLNKEDLIHKPVESEVISVNQKIVKNSNELDDRISYSFTLKEDSFISFNFIKNAFDNIKITGPSGLLFDGSPRILNDINCKGLEDFWFKTGVYKIEFNGKIDGNNFEFILQEQSSFLNIEQNLPSSVSLATKGDYQFFNLSIESNTEYWLHYNTSGQNISNLKFSLYSQDGTIISAGPLSSLYQILPKNSLNSKYILLIENLSNTQAVFKIDLIKKEVLQPKVIDLNTTVNDQFVGIEQQSKYSFTVDKMTALKIIEQLSNGSSNTYKIIDSNGLIVKLSHGVYILSTGNYTLLVESNNEPNDIVGEISFKTLITNSFLDVNFGSNMSININQGLPSNIIKAVFDKNRIYDFETNYNSGFIIYDEKGNVVKEIGSYYGYNGWFDVKETSAYYLQAFNYNGDYTGSVSFSLNSKNKYLNIDIGELVSNVSIKSNSLQKYNFTLTKESLYKINGYSSNYYLQISIYKKNSEGPFTHFNLNDAQPLNLDAGDYEISIYNYNNYSISYSLEIVDLLNSNISNVDLGKSFIISANNSRKANVQTITGVAGDSWLIDLRNSGTINQYIRWELYDPSGRQVTSSYQYANEDRAVKYTLTQSGQYILLVFGVDQNTQRETSILITKPVEVRKTVQIGEQVSGQIMNGGDVHYYDLKLDKPTSFIVDATLGQTIFNILREDGSLIDSNAYSIQYLPAGTYHLLFKGVNTQTPKYSFKLIDYIEKAEEVSDLSNISLALQENERFNFLQLNTVAGQKYSLEFLSPTNLWYQIVDINGQVLQSGNDYNTSTFTALADKYYIVIGRDYNINSVNNSNIKILPVLNTTQQLEFSELIKTSFETKFDQIDYTFSIAKEGWLDLSDVSSSNSNISLRLLNQTNDQLFYYSNLPAINGSSRIYLVEGNYTLRLNSNTSQSSYLKLKASIHEANQYEQTGQSLATAYELYLPTQSKIELLQPVVEQPYLYRFVLNKGDVFALKLSDLQGSLSLLDVAGSEIAVGSTGELQYSANSTSIYYLKIVNKTKIDKQVLNFTRSKLDKLISDDVGDTTENAKELNFKAGTKLEIKTNIGNGVNTNKDVDLYQIMLVASEKLNIDSYSNYGFLTQIFNSSGNRVYSTGGTGSYTAEQTGVYYIGFSGNQNNNYDPITGKNTYSSNTGLNTVLLSRQSGFIHPITQFSEQILIPENVTSTESWSGSLTDGTSQDFYLDVKTDGLYYLDRTAAGYYASNYDQVTLIDLQSRVLGTSFNAAYFLKAGKYKYTILKRYNNDYIDFKWVNLSSQAKEIQFGQSVSLGFSKNAAADRIYKFYADANQVLQFNSLGNISGTAPKYKIINEYGQNVSDVNLYASLDNQPINIKYSGNYYIVFDDISTGYGSEYYQYSGSVSFQIDCVDLKNLPVLSFNENVTGILNPDKQEVIYQLNINEKSNLLFDLLNLTDPEVQISIADYNGSIVYSSSSNNINASLLTLNVGSYTVKVKTTSLVQQKYGFKLLNLAQVQRIESGQAVEGRLKAEGEMLSYQIDVDAGDRVFIDFDQLITQTYGFFNGVWKQNYLTSLVVIDPYGRKQIISRNDLNNLGAEFVASVSGKYTIVFDELDRYDIELPFHMAVYVHAPSNPIVIDLNNNASKVDFSVQNLTVQSSDHETIKSGSQLEINWLLANIGNNSSFGDFTDRVLIKNKTTGEIIVESLVPYSEQNDGSISSNQSITRTTKIKLPEGISGAGDFEVIVEADVYNQQNETVESRKNNQTSYVFKSELRAYPNLTVEHISLSPAFNWEAGDSVTLNWEVKNSGQAPATGSWVEKIEIINLTTGTVVVSKDLLISNQTLEQGNSTQRQFHFIWPSDKYAVGQFSIKVKVDALNTISEFNQNGSLENDNEGTIEVVAGPDLVVKNIQLLQPQIQAGELVTVVWQDVNQGSVTTPTNFQDRIIIRARNTDGSIGKTILNFAVAFNGQDALPIKAGEVRNRSFSFTMPEGVAGAGQFVIEVVADSNITGQGIIYEVNALNNAEINNSSTETFISSPKMYADLAVSQIIVPETIGAGNLTQVQWTVTNRGDKAAEGQWVDRIILSRDSVIGNADDIILASYNRVKDLNVGESYQQKASITMPARLEGSYYIAVISDTNQIVKEPDTRANNQAISAQFNVVRTYADLSPEIISSPTVLGKNESGRITWKVTNNGTLATDVNRWVDTVYISTKSSFDSSASVLGSVTHTGGLAVGSAYQAYLDFALNGNADQYYLFVKTDSYGAVYEPDHTENNIVVSQSIVLEAEKLPDIQVSDISVESQWRSGNQVQLTYTLTNMGTADFTGFVYDRLRLVNITNPSQTYVLATPSFNRSIQKGDSITQQMTINVPALSLGAWRLEVISDVNNYVRELDLVSHQGTQNIEIVSPDLVVGNVKTTGGLQGGQNIDISWTTYNQGTTKAAQVKDIVYLSLDDVIDYKDIKIGEVVHSAIESQQFISSILNYKIPESLSGRWRLLIVTDADNKNFEYNAEQNNQYQQSLEIAKAEYADLIVSNIKAPTQVIGDPASLSVEWTVSNIGTGTGLNTTWTDTVIYSTDDIIGNSDDIVLGKVVHDGALEKNNSYTSSIQYRFGPNFTRHGHVFVQTDSLKQVWENDLESNNTVEFDHIVDVMPKAYADLQLTSLSIDNAENLMSGSSTTVRWAVSNNGIGITDKDSWLDHVWLSSQADGKGQLWDLGSVQHLGYLAANQSYEHSLTVTLPDGLSGNYYLNVGTNVSSSVFEFIHNDNNQKTGLVVPVQLADYPDLKVEDIIIPDNAQEGTEVDFRWTVRNQGTKNAQDIWEDSIRLVSLDNKPSIYLGNFNYTQGLESGKSYTRTEKINLPAYMEGRWRLEVATNNSAIPELNIYEKTIDRLNNTLISNTILNVELNSRPDLCITNVDVPNSVMAGSKISVKFTVNNMGASSTNSQWKDAVYLSLDGKLGSDDILIGYYDSISALAPKQSYSNITNDFTIPLRYRGDAYIIVVADSRDQVLEYPNEKNNIYVEKIYIEPKPFAADLIVSDIVAPEQVNYGSKISVDYKVTNKGTEKTQGDYTDVNSWIDSIWLSVDKRQPNPLKGDIKLGEVKHTGNLGIQEDYLGNLTVSIPGDIKSGQYYITVWSDTYDAIIEDTLATNINLDDVTQIDNNNYKARPITVFGAIDPTPDLTVIDIQAPKEISSNGDYKFSYTVRNLSDEVDGSWMDEVWLANDTDLTKANIVWKLGEFTQTKKLGYNETYTVERILKLAPSVSGLHLIVKTNTNDIRGKNNKNIYEKNIDNNKLSVLSKVNAAISDLAVTQVKVEKEAFSGEIINVAWTVENKGGDVWSGTQSWKDYIIISAYPEYNPEYSVILGSVEHSNAQGLKYGENYTATARFNIPIGYKGECYIYVVTDAIKKNEKVYIPDEYNSGVNSESIEFYRKFVYENSVNQNNIYSSPVTIIYREPDLIVKDIKISDINPNSGDKVTISWTVTNEGTRDTRVANWHDGIYLSRDNTIDVTDYPILIQPITINNSKNEITTLKVGESYTQTATFVLPLGIGGDFNIIVKTDTNYVSSGKKSQVNISSIRKDLEILNKIDNYDQGAILEFKDEGNNEKSIKLSINYVNPPDLQVINISSPKSAISGQKIDITYTVKNIGGKISADQKEWTDLIYLSNDRVLDLNKDKLLGFVNHSGGLATNAEYSASIQAKIPTELNGTYYVFVVTDPAYYRDGATGKVLEFENDLNNTLTSEQPLLITRPDPADLQVTDIMLPASTRIGEKIRVEYTVKNLADYQASGQWADAVYLSRNNSWDNQDILLGRYNHQGALNANQQYVGFIETILPIVQDGQWYIVVRPDIYNEVYEGDIVYTEAGLNIAPAEANNETTSATTFSVTVPTLLLNTSTDLELSSGDQSLYKLQVGQSETLRVRLDSSALKGSTELYIRYEAVPSAGQYDYAYTIANSPDQELVVPTTQEGTYYILIKASNSPKDTAATILAETLPLSITKVTPDQGGTGTDDYRWVTMDIYGAQFAAGALVKLSRPGMYEIEPERWQVLDATHIRAVFDLRHVPHGLYDIVVINPNGDRVVEPYRYLVERAIEPDVTIGLGGSNQLIPGDSGIYSISLQSLTNVDTPYVRFDIGAVEMGYNEHLIQGLKLPFFIFGSNVGGQPSGIVVGDQVNTQQYGVTPTDKSKISQIPWASLDGALNTSGINLAPGYAFDINASGFTGLSISIQTYPGLKEWMNRNFEGLRDQLYMIHPEWKAQGLLENGVKDLNNISPGLAELFVDTARPRWNEDALDFRFNIAAAATPITRTEFIQDQIQHALKMRDAILKDISANVSLKALAADEMQWIQGWLAAIEDAGLLRPENQAPPIKESIEVLSLTANLATGILLSKTGESYKTKASVLSFFEQMQKWYGDTSKWVGDNDALKTKIDYYELRIQPDKVIKIPVPKNITANDLILNNQDNKHYINFDVFVGNRSKLEYLRHVGLLDEKFDPIGVQALALNQYLQQMAAVNTDVVYVQGPSVMPHTDGKSYSRVRRRYHLN
ncbi:CARDB domain-containing protein [Acinetobacter genomosp. 33YU]|uniref:CARDB domain-containing protein n=1 Tax=Acinetobacter genomosp. 33YU TaxID=1675530 RepID=UPI001428B572|nr:CARDB domain-containing protein [Acinetobacter genomosp. 33YU]